MELVVDNKCSEYMRNLGKSTQFKPGNQMAKLAIGVPKLGAIGKLAALGHDVDSIAGVNKKVLAKMISIALGSPLSELMKYRADNEVATLVDDETPIAFACIMKILLRPDARTLKLLSEIAHGKEAIQTDKPDVTAMTIKQLFKHGEEDI